MKEEKLENTETVENVGILAGGKLAGGVPAGDVAADDPGGDGGAVRVPGGELAEARAENEALRQIIRLQDARDEVTARLVKAGARTPGLLFAHSAGELQFGDDGKLVNGDAIVERLRRSYPEQFGQEPRPTVDAGAGQTRPALTKEALAQMSPAEIARLDWAEVRSVLSGR